MHSGNTTPKWFYPVGLVGVILATASMAFDFHQRKAEWEQVDEAAAAYYARSEAIRICNEQGKMVGAFNKEGEGYTYRCVPLPGTTR